MQFWENFKLAVDAIRTNKMRSFLTMLGIIIGIAAVIAILTLGDSLTLYVTDNMESSGASAISLTVKEKSKVGGAAMDMVSSNGIETEDEVPVLNDLLTYDKIDAMKEHFGDRIEAVGIYWTGANAKAKEGRKEADVTVFGVNDGFLKIQGLKMLYGRWINDADVKGLKRVVVLSQKASEKLYRTQEAALGKEVKLQAGSLLQTYVVVGVYKYESSMANMMIGDTTEFYVPVSVVEQDYGYDPGFRSAYVMGPTGANVQELTDDLGSYFSQLYRKNNKWTIEATNFESMLKTMTDMLGVVSTIISIIAGISLLVGGIGVMNIMLVSVTERTREIGTRKAIGARNSAIRAQFITESAILCTIGGIFGVALGLAMGMAGSILIGFPTTASIPAIIFSVSFSMAIGIFFGYYPANKASKLDPIDALRYE